MKKFYLLFFLITLASAAKAQEESMSNRYSLELEFTNEPNDDILLRYARSVSENFYLGVYIGSNQDLVFGGSNFATHGDSSARYGVSGSFTFSTYGQVESSIGIDLGQKEYSDDYDGLYRYFSLYPFIELRFDTSPSLQAYGSIGRSIVPGLPEDMKEEVSDFVLAVGISYMN